jgi:hypothetical protein
MPAPEATKQDVYNILDREMRKHPWAADENRLANAMFAVAKTLIGARTCALTESWVIAWKEIGRKGKPTYKGLHALPGTVEAIRLPVTLFPKGSPNEN